MQFEALHSAFVGGGKDGMMLVVFFFFFPVVFGSPRIVLIKKAPVLLSYLFPGTLSDESKLLGELFFPLVFARSCLLRLPVWHL